MPVLPYDKDQLAIALANEYTSIEVIQAKNHYKYLLEYLGDNGLRAKTILIESEYVSKDFLDDYSSYYAYCFQSYGKSCRRIHFFDSVFTDAELQLQLTRNSFDEEFWSHYLGFVVIKPIPVTVIGFSVLKTYPSSQQLTDRHFWGTREYVVHIHGREIRIQSLAFQEQDSVLAACATTAVWSTLNKAAVLYHTQLLSPSQITSKADKISSDGNRLFPNKGLTILQIGQALLNTGMVSEVKKPDVELPKHLATKQRSHVVSATYAKKVLHAYAPLGIPLIFGISVPNGGRYGLHAITVSGTKMAPAQPTSPSEEISWVASDIERLYAHDDQWGPFVRIRFLDEYSIETPWTTQDYSKRPTFITNIVVPVYPKVRIAYEDIEAIVVGLDEIFSTFFDNLVKYDLVWSIQIDLSERFKASIRESSLTDEQKMELLLKSFPKYLWFARCYLGNHRILEFVFDATDVSNGMMGKAAISYMPASISTKIHEFLSRNSTILRKLIRHNAGSDYFDFVRNGLGKYCRTTLGSTT